MALIKRSDPPWPETWPALLETPWEDTLAKSPWPIFELLAAWGQRKPEEDSMIFVWAMVCDDVDATQKSWDDYAFQNAGQAVASTPLAQPLSKDTIKSATVSLLKIVNASLFGTACTAMLWGVLASLLSLGPFDSTVISSSTSSARMVGTFTSPAYALRFISMVLRRRTRGSDEEVSRALVHSIWPVVPLLARVAKLARQQALAMDHAAEEEWPEVSIPVPSGDDTEQHSNEVPNAFRVMSRSRAVLLEDTLRVSHNFFAALGLSYIVIAGTLLGAVRHLSRIPWDDDVDLCIDAARGEGLMLALVAAQEARRLGISDDFGNSLLLPDGLSWQARKALKYLESEGHILRITAQKALTFEIERVDGSSNVGLWMCWGLDAPDIEVSADHVAYMSLVHGPRVPRQMVVPRQKLPFGKLTLWGPSDPHGVTEHYMNHSGWSTDARKVCRGRKVHSGNFRVVSQEFKEEVPCKSLRAFFDFAGPRAEVHRGSEFDEVMSVMTIFFKHNLPGLHVPSADDFTVARVSTDGSAVRTARSPVWYFLDLSRVASAIGGDSHCKALLWWKEPSTNLSEELLEPGALPHGYVLRSFTCRHSTPEDAETTFVWEDAYQTSVSLR
eukprot:TRINITY_DN27559_c0_g1_i2.p1 TRINITY_DN27559_c0_g1~~TRINITY_DN27559_c0_g1_i2.p1  ORF type:complete len:660 (+),score=109.69 TRINITY_DN27559_c0_g1_i2:143-1981(+)